MHFDSPFYSFLPKIEDYNYLKMQSSKKGYVPYLKLYYENYSKK